MKNELNFEQRLSQIQSNASMKMDALHSNFNQIKDDMLFLNKEYERLNKEKREQQLQQIRPFQEEMIAMISEETKINEAFVLENCIQFDNAIDIIKESYTSNKEELNSEYGTIHNQIAENINAITQQLEMVRSGRDQTQLTLIDEMNSEFKQQKCEDNRNECITAIQTMLMNFCGQFKDNQLDKRDFEEKIVFLLEDLCKKIRQMK